MYRIETVHSGYKIFISKGTITIFLLLALGKQEEKQKEKTFLDHLKRGRQTFKNENIVDTQIVILNESEVLAYFLTHEEEE